MSSHNGNQYYYQQQQPQKLGGGRNHSYHLQQPQLPQQQQYANVYYNNSAGNNNINTAATTTTANSNVSAAASHYYEPLQFNNYNMVNTTNSNINSNDAGGIGMFFNPLTAAASSSSSTNSTSNTINNLTAVSSVGRLISDWPEFSPPLPEDDHLLLHPYYHQQHQYNNYSTANNNGNNNYDHYYLTKNKMYTHYNDAATTNMNNTNSHNTQQQQQQNLLTAAITRNNNSTNNSFYPYLPSDFDPIQIAHPADVFTPGNNNNNSHHHQTVEQYRNHNSTTAPATTTTTTTSATSNYNTTNNSSASYKHTNEISYPTTSSSPISNNPSLLPQQYQPQQKTTNKYNKDNLSKVNFDSTKLSSTATASEQPKASSTTEQQTTTTTIQISGISNQPLKSSDILKIVSSRGTDVITKYLPCVEFLVLCQQELRRAVEKNQKVPAKQRCSTKQFYSTYLQPLSDRFYRKNFGIMPTDHLQTATKALHQLLVETKKSESLGCDQMKVTFLGGMREGQSWGLRNWLSKYGSALQVCNELEMILLAMQKLDPSSTFTINLASQIRKEASYARKRLLHEVPKAYQQFSSAHPFLPFFHRLDSALKGLAEFDPEDDDVVILDDAEQENLKAAAAAAKAAATAKENRSNKRNVVEILDDSHTATTNSTAASKRANISSEGESSNNYHVAVSTEANNNSYATECIQPLNPSDFHHLANTNANEIYNYNQMYPSLNSNKYDTKGISLSPTPFITAAGANLRRYSGGGDVGDELAYEELGRLLESENNNHNRIFDCADTISRDVYSPSQGDWRCLECAYINTSCVDYCLMCERNRNPSTTLFVNNNTENNNTNADNTLILF